MCGIAGIVSLKLEPVDNSVLQKMTDIISHRGPDGEGHYVDESKRIGFGHRRLSIIDLSTHASQPMEMGNLWITYNGEIYNYIELKEELTVLGAKFSTESDTEVILAAYQFWGKECIQKFNGMWAFAIYDAVADIVFCSRDRYGIKPFYYFRSNSFLYFASEIKQFTILPGWQSELNYNRAFDFIDKGYLSHTDETLFENVFELRGGYNLCIDLVSKEIKIDQYYKIDDLQNTCPWEKKEEGYIAEFKETMDNAVELCLRSDVKVGSALSGGIDSSIIASVASEKLARNLQKTNQECVSACFDDVEVDESFFIDAVTKYADIKVHKIYPSFEEFLGNLDKLIWHQDEPFGTMSIYAQYSVFQEASKKNITVMLDGQGADEILAGYSSFYKPLLKQLFKKNPIKALKLIFSYLKLHKDYSFDLIFNSLFRRKKEKINIFESTFEAKLTNKFVRSNEETIFDCSQNHISGFGLHSLLRYEDRNSMAFSIESRVPFLDYRVVNLSLSLPDDLKIKDGIRKYILREAFKKEIPDVIYRRYDKLGFPTPQERWTKENEGVFMGLMNDARDILGANIINKVYFDTIVRNIKSLTKDEIFQAWRIIIFSKWMKIYNVKIS